MKMYELNIDVKAPIQITDATVGNVLKSSSLYYLPSSVIKGAILTKMYKEYGVEKVKEESRDPKLSIRPAYPLKDGIEARPPHPLLYRCKLCGSTFLIEDAFKDADSLFKFRYENFKLPLRCPKNHLFAVTKVSNLVVFNKNEKAYKEFGITTSQLEFIGMNRLWGGTELGMLYSYIVIEPGSTFRTILVDEEGAIKNWIDELPKKDTYFIGRGRSRGMGLVKISINEVDDGYIEKRAKEVEGMIEKLKGLVILRAVSPVLNNFRTYEIDLSQIGLKPHNVYKNYNYIPNGRMVLKGYSMMTNLPKISLECLSPGTLYFYEVSNKANISEISRKLTKYEVKGITPPHNIGLNYLETYTDVEYVL